MSEYRFPLQIAGLGGPPLARALDQNMRDLEHWLGGLPPTVYPFFFPISPLTVGTLPLRLYMPVDCSILGVAVTVAVAPTGADAIFDVNLDGTTVFTDQDLRPTIPAGEYVSGWMKPAVRDWGAGSYLVFACDQVGSTIAGAYPCAMLWLGGRT